MAESDRGQPHRRAEGVIRGSIRRFVEADGPSHSRAFAYHSMFVLLSGFIGVIGLATILDIEVFRSTVRELTVGLAPGPAGRVLQSAISHGSSQPTAAVLGLGAALVTGTLAMSQFQRSANRLLGIDRDRRPLRRLAVAFLLAMSAGLLLASAAMLLAGGRALATGTGWDTTVAWTIVRWPLGVVVAGVAILLLYRVAPRGRPGSRSAMLIGSAVAIVLWILFTGLLAVYFAVGDRTAETYGPLVGVVALLLWSGLSSLALHIGFAVTAQLAGRPGTSPRTITIPEAAPTPR
jgi:YihY family inner membrane protein